MSKEKAPIDFTMKDWRNLGIYLMLIGLIIAFLGGDFILGMKFFAIGFIFTLIFQGSKIFKILKEISDYLGSR